MNVQELITIDNDILGGQTVFKGTRVPVESLFDHLEAGVSLDEFLGRLSDRFKRAGNSVVRYRKQTPDVKKCSSIVCGCCLTKTYPNA